MAWMLINLIIKHLRNQFVKYVSFFMPREALKVSIYLFQIKRITNYSKLDGKTETQFSPFIKQKFVLLLVFNKKLLLMRLK